MRAGRTGCQIDHISISTDTVVAGKDGAQLLSLNRPQNLVSKRTTCFHGEINIGAILQRAQKRTGGAHLRVLTTEPLSGRVIVRHDDGREMEKRGGDLIVEHARTAKQNRKIEYEKTGF